MKEREREGEREGEREEGGRKGTSRGDFFSLDSIMPWGTKIKITSSTAPQDYFEHFS